MRGVRMGQREATARLIQFLSNQGPATRGQLRAYCVTNVTLLDSILVELLRNRILATVDMRPSSLARNQYQVTTGYRLADQ